MVRRYEPAFALIVKGNAKAITFPPPSLDTDFPALANYKSLAKLVAARAHVHRADGDTEGALKDLRTGVVFARRISGGKLIDYLVGAAMQSIPFREFEPLLPGLNVAQLMAVRQTFEGWLREPDPFVQALLSEQGQWEWMLANTFASTKNSGDAKKDPIAALSPAQQSAVFIRIRDRVRKDSQRLVQGLSRPEAGWYDRTSEPLQETAGSDEEDSIDSIEELEAVYSSVMETSQSCLTVVGKVRTGYRLVSRSAEIERFRLVNDRLPTDLREVFGADVTDPFSGKSFGYEKISPVAFKLRSEGTPRSREITFNDRPKRDTGKDEVANP